MKHLLSSLFFFYIIFIYGCGGGTETISLNMKCDDDCNANNAIVVKVYQLKNADKFRNASFESLISNTEEILGEDLIPNSKYEKTLIPGESFLISEYEIKHEAVFLGIVGDFFSPAKDSWQQVVPASDFDNIQITVHENSISVVKD